MNPRHEVAPLQDKADLKNTLSKLDTLPAMPAVAQKLLTLPLETSKGENAMLKLIEHDPQLSAKIIGLANSPLFGASQKVTSVRDAAMLLGMTRVKSVAIGISAMTALTKMPQGRLSLQDLWLHSLTVALSMRTIVQHMPAALRPDDDEIFLAGLLHDIGYLVLAYLDTKLSDELHAKLAAPQPGLSMLEIELQLLGITHNELSALLAENWGLPDDIIAALRRHHEPESAEIAHDNRLIGLINIAEKLHPAFGVLEFTEQEIRDQEWIALGIDPASCEGIRASVAAQAEQAKQLANTMA